MENIKCPHCGKSNYKESSTTTTLTYSPTVRQDGEIISADRNYYTTYCLCLECGKMFRIIERAGVIEAIL